MFRAYLERGLLAGAVGGLAFGLFVAVLGNPLVGYVEELGHAAEAGGHHGADHGGHAVSATVTTLVSVGGGVLWGLLLGAVFFGVGYYFLEPAIPGTGATKRYVLASAGFVTVSGAPWLLVPPQPAGVELALPTGTRVLVYGGMALAGALCCVLAGSAYTRLTARGTDWRAAAVASLVPLATLAGLALAGPTIGTTGEVPAGMAAVYRGVVVFGQVWLWVVLAGAHAWLSTRTGSLRPDTEHSIDGSGGPAD